MQSLKEIKSIIFETDCADYICEGLCCSEPIVTKGENGLIDNYFIYACDDDGRKFSRPLVTFGIYSDLGRTAYKRTDLEFEDKEYSAQELIDEDKLFAAYDKYVEIFPMVRSWAFSDCTAEQKKIVQEYLQALEVISGSVLWDFYRKLSPSFFEWAQQQ